jgi:hypothetical protein
MYCLNMLNAGAAVCRLAYHNPALLHPRLCQCHAQQDILGSKARAAIVQQGWSHPIIATPMSRGQPCSLMLLCMCAHFLGKPDNCARHTAYGPPPTQTTGGTLTTCLYKPRGPFLKGLEGIICPACGQRPHRGRYHRTPTHLANLCTAPHTPKPRMCTVLDVAVGLTTSQASNTTPWLEGNPLRHTRASLLT